MKENIFKQAVTLEVLQARLAKKEDTLQKLKENLVSHGKALITKKGLMCEDPFWQAILTIATAQINSLKYRIGRCALEESSFEGGLE